MVATRVYLAGRYSRREEFCRYRAQFEQWGIEVTSRWLNGDHKIDRTGAPVTDGNEPLEEFLTADGKIVKARSIEELRTRFAYDDLEDVRKADVFILFTEDPLTPFATRGGRHVEFGYALALGKSLVAIGPRENLFTWMPQVAYFPTWGRYVSHVDPALTLKEW